MAKTVQELREERVAGYAASRLGKNPLLNYVKVAETPKVKEEEGAQASSSTSDAVINISRAFQNMMMGGMISSNGFGGVSAFLKLAEAAGEKFLPEVTKTITDTVQDGVNSVKEGAHKSVEGVVDFGAGLVGSVGGLFSENFRDSVQDFIATDWVGDWYKQDYYKKEAENSIIEEGGMVDNLLHSAGGMLPSIGVSILNPAAGQAVLFAGAAGNAAEQAYNDGAGFYQGQLYGAVTGGIELATEKLSGAVGNFGKGYFDDVIRSIAPSGVKRFVANTVSEGLEEVGSELANPLAKTIYKGRDALSEYGTLDYWKGVGEAGVSGMALGSLYGGAFDIASGGMKNADIRAAQEEIEAIKERARRQEDAGKLTAEKEAHADADILANYRVIEDVLKKADATKRAELIKNNDLSSLFDADGSLNADFTKRLDGSVTSDYNRKYYNRAMHGNEDVIQGDLERINADLAQKYNGKAEKVSVYDGELSAKAEGAYNKIKKFLNVISRKSGKDIGLVVTNSSPQFNGINIDDRVYATTDNLESGKVFKTIVEETTHFAEGTQEHRALVALLSSDASLVESTVGRLLSTKGYGFDANRLRMVGEKIASGAVDASDFGAEAVKYSIKNKESALTDDEAGATLYYKGGQSYSLNERLRETPDVDSLPEDVRKKVEMLDSALKKLPTYKGVTYRNIGFDDNGGEEAFHDFMRRHTEGEIVAYTAYTSASTAQDGYPIEGNYVVHMVIEGKNGRNLDGFGNNMESEVLFERETMFFIDKIVYAENGIPTIYMQEVNENGIGQLYSAERGTAVRNMQEHNPQELGLQGLSERKTEGDSTGSMGSQGELSGGQWDSVRAEGSELRSKRTVREEQDRANGEEELNSDDYAMYAEFASEVGAHMSAEMLGNEAFIDRIIRSDASLAEKILGKIIDVKNALSRIGDPEAQAQHKRLVEAEKLYLKAIEAAGYRYVDGKIVVPEDEEKENTAEGGEKYSYESLIKKGNMNIATLKPLNEVEASRYSSDHTAMAKHAMQIARDVKNEKNTDQRTYLYCDDIKEDIMVSPKSFKHSAARTDSEYCQVCFSLPEILENAIVVNELSPRGKNNGSLVLLGMAQTEERYVYVRMVVENRTWNLENYDIVYAIKKQSIEKEDVSQKAPGLRQKDGSQTSSVISIADFLHNVKSFEVINEVFSKDIANKLGVTRYTGDLSKDLRYSFKENAEGKKTTPPATKEYKQYSQKEVKALVGDILSDELVFEKGKATFEKKADIEQEVKKLLDTVSLEKSPEKAIGKIADYLLEKAHIKGVYADVSEEITRHQKTVESFSRYIRCLDLTPVMAKLTKKDGKMSGAFYRWNNRKGNAIITLEQLKEELAEKGYGVKNKTPEQVFFMMDDAYLKADKALKKHEKEHGTLKAVLSDEEYSTARAGIVERITKVYHEGGKTSEGMRVIAEREKKLSEREARAAEKSKEAMREVKDAEKATLYSQEEAQAVIDKILNEVLVFSDMRGELRHGTYASSINKAFAMLNSAEPGKQWSAAYELAGFIMKRASLVDTIDPAEAKPYMDAMERLKPYLRGVDLSSIKKKLGELTKSDSAYRRWHKAKDKGGISIEEFFEKLRAEGYELDENAVRAMAMIDEEYVGVKDALSEKMEASLEEVILGKDAEQLKREIAKVVFNSFDEDRNFTYANLQKVARSFAAKLERVTAESRQLRREKMFYEGEYEKYYSKYRDARDFNEKSKGLADATRATLGVIKDIKNWKKGNFQSAAKQRNSNFEETIGSFARLEINGQLNRGGGRKIFEDALKWYSEDNEIFTGYFDSDVVDKMREIADGKGMYTAAEVKKMGDVVKHFKKIVEEYGKIFRRGKYIEARPEAERYQSYITEDIRLNTTFTLHSNKLFREISEPLALAMSADRYRVNGFFTETIQEIRQGLIKKEWLEMSFRKDFDEFMKKQGRKYQRSLGKEFIKVGDLKIPKNNALFLYMTTKDADSHGALNVGGFSIVDGAKKQIHDQDTKKAIANDGLIYERIAAGEDVTLEEATAAISKLRSELYAQFSEADKELIKIAEKFFNVDGKKVKHDTDMEKKGYSNVKEGYYAPMSHDGHAEELGLETEREGVLTYKFNKSRVKGAKGRLLIRPLTDVLLEQMSDTATYAGLTAPIENFNRLYNLNTADNKYRPKTIKKMLSDDKRFWSEGKQYIQKMINGIEGSGESLGIISKAFGVLRGGLVRTWLSLNPKVLATQVSALAASFSRLNPKYTGKSLLVSVGKEGAAEMDKYCQLAALRNQDNSAALAQGVLDDINRIGDVGMKGIGWVDRLMITRLWHACRLQVEGEQGLKFDSEANKVAAGKLLETVILDTQQNSLITERSAMMRSNDEMFKFFAMFSADGMKMMARFLGGYGHMSTVYRRIKLAKDQNASSKVIAELEQERKTAKKEFGSAAAGLLTSSVYMAAISLLFSALYGKLDDEDEPADLALDFGADIISSMVGGLPIIREIWDFIANGYEIDNHAISAINEILTGVKGVFSLSWDLLNGKQVKGSEFGGKIKNMLYAVGQIFGVPLRNVHNVMYGITRFIDGSAAYKWESSIYSQSYKSDLKKAIENGDEKMVSTIADLMLDESVGGMDEGARKALKSLVEDGYDVLPRSVGDSVTVDGEAVAFTGRQRKRFMEVYDVADEAVAELVKLSQFGKATDEVKAKAIKFIYDIYYDLATEDVFGVDLADKNILFAEAIDIEKLALIVATARAMVADKDKSGKVISGSRKAKITAYIESLRVSAAEKYMLMGYLGYTNVYGETQVKAYINRLSLTAEEKAELLTYSGYPSAAKAS